MTITDGLVSFSSGDIAQLSDDAQKYLDSVRESQTSEEFLSDNFNRTIEGWVAAFKESQVTDMRPIGEKLATFPPETRDVLLSIVDRSPEVIQDIVNLLNQQEV